MLYAGYFEMRQCDKARPSGAPRPSCQLCSGGGSWPMNLKSFSHSSFHTHVGQLERL
jgi:hypothetical protein